MMDLFWMLLGLLITLSITLIYLKLHVAGKMNGTAWTLAVITIIMSIFTLAWSVASINENEMQAAGMGLLIFGGATGILAILTKKVISKNSQKVKASENITAR